MQSGFLIIPQSITMPVTDSASPNSLEPPKGLSFRPYFCNKVPIAAPTRFMP